MVRARPQSRSKPSPREESDRYGHIFIENVSPSVDEGRYPAKGTVGYPCVVEADIFRDGHDVIRAAVKWRRKGARHFFEAPLRALVNDRWRGAFPLLENGFYEFVIEAWTDGWSSWLVDLEKRVTSGLAVESEVLEGIHMLEKAAAAAAGAERAAIGEAIVELRGRKADPQGALRCVSRSGFADLVARTLPRYDTATSDRPYDIFADRVRGCYGAWYELFPRSQGTEPRVHGTFRDVGRRLADIRSMGFDVLYLPPIHPIGRRGRKGRNNTLRAAASDPGSPWAIGNENGGHTAIEPALGTMNDFKRLLRTAREHELEIALDFAIQCSPDHPWVKEHPEWFYHRPDGTIKFAENPPKKYEDIYPINFDSDDKEGLYEALRDVLLFWIDAGVKIFRVDNPHTKPIGFWQWVIGTIRAKHPDVIFLAEAFTRPKVMNALAKVGFTQSYTYFTWRNTKAELAAYMTELTQTESRHFFRPNFWPNTPDILPEVLQKGGRNAFRVRLILAATLSPSYGVYGGYELCENEALPGREEYLNSEKYEVKVRDWDAPGNIKADIARINGVRRGNAALHELANLRFYQADNDNILCYAKRSHDGSNTIIVVVNLDPHHAHHCSVYLPLEDFGVPADGHLELCDLLTGARYTWGGRNFVRLDPWGGEPAHILRVEKRV